jgi:hypothetical protein
LLHLTVTTQRKLLATLPVGTTRWTQLGGTRTTGKETTRLAASGGETTVLTMLHGRVADPVDTRIVTDSGVVWIDKNDFEELLARVLTNPIRVEHTQVSATATDTLLGERTESTFALPVDTLVYWLTMHGTLAKLTFASTTTHSDGVDNVTLLGLVTETTGLIWTSWVRLAVNVRQLTKFPDADTEQETHHIGLLSLPELFHILVGTHVELLKVFFLKGMKSVVEVESTDAGNTKKKGMTW